MKDANNRFKVPCQFFGVNDSYKTGKSLWGNLVGSTKLIMKEWPLTFKADVSSASPLSERGANA